jgi:protein-L-isoaspartate(D-aspartate) O-methyltransferase
MNVPPSIVRRISRRQAFGPTCIVLLLGVVALPLVAQIDDRWELRCEAMVQESLISAGIQNERVLAAMRSTPRHLFVARHLRPQAYLDMALPIGEQQTISSPFIVAYMTECLDPQPDDRVLEIGTGSGYQAAVLSPLVQHVYTIEIVEPLGRQAARILKQLRLDNVTTKIGDGFEGWPEHAPFDKIIVTCSPEEVPQALIDQLRDGGRMVIPVGERYQQTMFLFRKEHGELQHEALRPTLFVPMTGRADQDRDVLPDPDHPQLRNGAFEAEANDAGFIAGWYYQRQGKLVSDTGARQPGNYVEFENQTPGRDAHLMQGLAINGRKVHRIRIRGKLKTANMTAAPRSLEGPRVVISFFDDNRRDLGLRWLGPWPEQTSWREFTGVVVVPSETREMILRIGLFGATGKAAFDDMRLEVVP